MTIEQPRRNRSPRLVALPVLAGIVLFAGLFAGPPVFSQATGAAPEVEIVEDEGGAFAAHHHELRRGHHRHPRRAGVLHRVSRRAPGLVWCLTNTPTNLRVLLAVGCVALPRVVHATRAGLKPAPTSHRALPTTKILCILPCALNGQDTSVVSHKYGYESAGPFGRRLRCSSSRGTRPGATAGRPYESSRLAEDQNALASS